MILFHITSAAAYQSIAKTGLVKPGPKNVWVDRKPTGYIRKGGKVWLCEEAALPRVRAHLRRLGKATDWVLAVRVGKTQVKPFHPVPGVFYAERPVIVSWKNCYRAWES